MKEKGSRKEWGKVRKEMDEGKIMGKEKEKER